MHLRRNGEKAKGLCGDAGPSRKGYAVVSMIGLGAQATSWKGS